jgi:hypothetical protein
LAIRVSGQFWSYGDVVDGDGFGALIVSPLLLSWSTSRSDDRKTFRDRGLFVLLLIVVLIVLQAGFPDLSKHIRSLTCVCRVCSGRH